MSKIAYPSKQRAELSVEQFDLSTKVWTGGFFLWLSFYLSKRISLCSKYGFFFLSQLELSRAEFPKLTWSILIENCDHATCPGLWILFLYAPAHMVWLFESRSLS